jgi:hypothetical protein
LVSDPVLRAFAAMRAAEAEVLNTEGGGSPGGELTARSVAELVQKRQGAVPLKPERSADDPAGKHQVGGVHDSSLST